MGILGIIFAMLNGAIVLTWARNAGSPALFVLVFGGLAVGIPLAMAIGCLSGHLPVRGERNPRR